MAPHSIPMFGEPNFDWPSYYVTTTEYYPEENVKIEENNPNDLGRITFWYMMVLIIMLMTWLFLYFCLRLIAYRQKTRNTQQRRVYVPGSRQRQLSVQGEPTIFVSPANLPPPPKYECMAPPSYEEVMGVHYPAFQAGQQPITQPLTHALAQGSSTNPEAAPNTVTINVTNNVGPSVAPCATPAVEPPTVTVDAPAVVTVTTEQRRTSVAVRA